MVVRVPVLGWGMSLSQHLKQKCSKLLEFWGSLKPFSAVFEVPSTHPLDGTWGTM